MDFNQLVKTYHQKVYWQVRRMVLNHEDANDVTQDIFVKVYQKYDTFKGESKFSSWLYRVAYNETINFLNKQSKLQASSIDDYLEQSVNNLQADVFFDGDESALLLQKAIQTLPEKQRMVFMYKYFDELKYEEISKILNLSVGGLKATYHIAMNKIKDYVLQHH